MNSVTMEDLILGSCFNSPSVLVDSLERIFPSDFRDPHAERMYITFVRLHQEGVEISFEKVFPLLEEDQREYFNKIVNVSFGNSESKFFFDMFVKENKERALSLEMSSAVNSLGKGALCEKVIEDIHSAIHKFEEGESHSIATKMDSLIDSTKESFEKSVLDFSEGRTGFKGVSSGFPDIDRITNGFGNSNLVIIGARTGVGKSAFVINSIYRSLKISNNPVLLVSLEMNSVEILNRFLAIESKVDSNKISTGSLKGIPLDSVREARARLKNLNLFIWDKGGISFDYLRAYSKRMVKEKGVKAIYIDYMQLLKDTGRFENRQAEMAEISKKMKVLAKDLDVPVIALCQLNRDVEKRQDKHPLISDLRESGQLEQDADIIILIHRPEMYNPSDNPGIIKVSVSKNRHGECANCKLNFNKKSQFISDYIPIEDPSEEPF